MTSARRLTLAAAAFATSAALVLSGCANQEPGSAATFSDSRITEAQLTDQVMAVLEAKGQSTSTPDPGLVQQTLGRMITMVLVNRLAEDQGIVVTQGDLDEMRVRLEAQVGGSDALQQAFLQENVAPSQLEALLLLQIQAQELGIALNPRGSAEEQGMAVFEAVSALSTDLDTTVSPRFGTWDPISLALGAVPNDLSTPPVIE